MEPRRGGPRGTRDDRDVIFALAALGDQDELAVRGELYPPVRVFGLPEVDAGLVFEGPHAAPDVKLGDGEDVRAVRRPPRVDASRGPLVDEAGPLLVGHREALDDAALVARAEDVVGVGVPLDLVYAVQARGYGAHRERLRVADHQAILHRGGEESAVRGEDRRRAGALVRLGEVQGHLRGALRRGFAGDRGPTPPLGAPSSAPFAPNFGGPRLCRPTSLGAAHASG